MSIMTDGYYIIYGMDERGREGGKKGSGNYYNGCYHIALMALKSEDNGCAGCVGLMHDQLNFDKAHICFVHWLFGLISYYIKNKKECNKNENVG
jgi:hypothetical protein